MFTSRDAAKVAASLGIHAHPPLRTGEIARAASIPVFRVQNGLRALAQLGLIDISEARGHRVYRLDSRSPHLRAATAAAVVDLGLREALAPIAHRIRFALVIGSFARGQVTESSDFDLLVVGDASRSDVEHLVEPILARHDRQVDVIALTDDEYHRRLSQGDYVLRGTVETGQLLMGDPDLVHA